MEPADFLELRRLYGTCRYFCYYTHFGPQRDFGSHLFKQVFHLSALATRSRHCGRTRFSHGWSGSWIYYYESEGDYEEREGNGLGDSLISSRFWCSRYSYLQQSASNRGAGVIISWALPTWSRRYGRTRFLHGWSGSWIYYYKSEGDYEERPGNGLGDGLIDSRFWC